MGCISLLRQDLRGSILSDWSEAKIVSKDAGHATNLGQPAPFDTRSTPFRVTQDASLEIRPQTEMLPLSK